MVHLFICCTEKVFDYIQSLGYKLSLHLTIFSKNIFIFVEKSCNQISRNEFDDIIYGINLAFIKDHNCFLK